MRSAQGSSQRLWLHGSSPNGFFVPCSDQGYWRKYDSGSPLPPASGYPCAGTHHLWRFSLSLIHNYDLCKDLQQLWIELDPNLSSPIRVHIRNIPDIYLYMCSPLGTLRPDTPPLRAASDPVRSYLSIVQYVRSRALALIFVGRLCFAKALSPPKLIVWVNQIKSNQVSLLEVHITFHIVIHRNIGTLPSWTAAWSRLAPINSQEIWYKYIHV